MGKTIVLGDPTKKIAKYSSGSNEINNLKSKVLPGAKRLLGKDTCREGLRIVGAKSGSFTKKGAKQRSVLYEFCEFGNGMATDGIAIFENDKLVGSFVFDGAIASNFIKLPDINRNGIDELAIDWTGGMHQGKVGASTVVLETAGRRLLEIGATQSFWSVCDGDASTLECGYSYKLTVKPQKHPVFFAQKMVGGNGKPWKNVGRVKQISLKRTTVDYKRIE